MADPLQPPKPLKPVEPDLGQMRQKFFAQRRDDLSRESIGQQQQQDDAINRRFASMGMSGSGAAIGAQMKAREALNNQKNAAFNDLAGQEMTADMQGQLADRDFGFKKDVFDVESKNKSRELDLADKYFDLDASTTAFNRSLAEGEMNRKPPGLLDSLGLGGGSKNPVGFIADPIGSTVRGLTGGGK